MSKNELNSVSKLRLWLFLFPLFTCGEGLLMQLPMPENSLVREIIEKHDTICEHFWHKTGRHLFPQDKKDRVCEFRESFVITIISLMSLL